MFSYYEQREYSERAAEERLKAAAEGAALVRLLLHEHSVHTLLTSQTVLTDPKMSGKNFRVSDGDWICPDKK